MTEIIIDWTWVEMVIHPKIPNEVVCDICSKSCAHHYFFNSDKRLRRCPECHRKTKDQLDD